MVQAPAEWIKLDFSEQTLAAGKNLAITATASGSLSNDRNTSATFEAVGSSDTYRFTVAFLSGKGPDPIRKINPIKPAKKSVAPLNVPKPSTSLEKK